MPLLPVEIVGTGSFLPGDPISNDQIESVLRPLAGAPAKLQHFVQIVGPRMLERSGITRRHFAIDPQTHDSTHTFSSLAEPACRRALEAAGIPPNDVELLVISCPIPDFATPPTSTILQERLGIRACAELEIHSNCTGVGKGVECAFNALRSGQYVTALVAYSQLSSLYLRSDYFNQAKVSKDEATLRWILSDGAGAVALRVAPNADAVHQVLGTFVASVGTCRPPGMTAGGAGVDLVNHSLAQVYEDGTHHLWQDFAAVGKDGVRVLFQGIQDFLKKLHVEPSAVDHYIISVPTLPLYDDYIRGMAKQLGVSLDRMRFHSGKSGYCGGAATLVALDDMVRSGEIRTNQTIVVHAVESSKWMTAGFAVRW
jgi:3-oxoacyl-[acyl-carrier-protein] synthase III